MKITDAQRNALKWLHERGGSGYLDQEKSSCSNE